MLQENERTFFTVYLLYCYKRKRRGIQSSHISFSTFFSTELTMTEVSNANLVVTMKIMNPVEVREIPRGDEAVLHQEKHQEDLVEEVVEEDLEMIGEEEEASIAATVVVVIEVALEEIAVVTGVEEAVEEVLIVIPEVEEGLIVTQEVEEGLIVPLVAIEEDLIDHPVATVLLRMDQQSANVPSYN